MFGRGKKQQPTEGPQTQPLTEAEVGWRDGQLAEARRLTATGPGELPTLSDLDAVVADFLASGDPAGTNDVVNAVGIAFGHHLARDLGLDWVIATDAWGTDLALFGQPGSVVLYPANMCAKRIAARETPFVQALHGAMVASVLEMRSRA